MQRGGIKELAREYSGEIYVAITAVFTISGLYFFFFIFPSLNLGGDSLLFDSKNAECGNEIQKALLTFSQSMDMHYIIDPEDYKVIFNEGQMQKKYIRDGIQYTAYFNINKTKEGCFLKYFKRGISQPGHFETTLGNYGSIILPNCQCE